MSSLWQLHANGDCWPDSCRACQYEDGLRAWWPRCAECDEATDPEECAPSCDSHTICLPCFNEAGTEDPDCIDCHHAQQETTA